MLHPEGKRLIEKQRLVELLGDKDERVRAKAVRVLAKSFPGSEGVIELLLRAIEGNIEENVACSVVGVDVFDIQYHASSPR